MEKKTETPMGHVIERSIQSGLSGAAAMGINVATLMWMRTTINYQYVHGTGTIQTMKTLYKQGGIPRFYRGVAPALIQGPMARFGDTAANTGTIVALDSNETTRKLPIWAKSACASLMAAAFRITLMPIDTIKTNMQVQGKEGFKNVITKVKTNGPQVLFHGSLASASATWVGHFPWFATYNTLQEKIPKTDDPFKKLARQALIGFTSTCVSDTLSNSIRVVKVYKQSNTTTISYPEIVKEIVTKEGMIGLFGRGLKTKLLANGFQGLMFSVLWKYIDEKFQQNKK
jgi:hypothetical protein